MNLGVSFNWLVDLFLSFDHFRMFSKRIHKKKAPGSESWWSACSSFSNYARDLAILLEFVLMFCFFCGGGSGSAAPQKDRHNVAFLEQLVNMTLCPAEQKNASSPCPQRPAWRSRWLRAGSRRGATLVKSKHKSMWRITPRGSSDLPHVKPAKCSRLHVIKIWKPKLDPYMLVLQLVAVLKAAKFTHAIFFPSSKSANPGCMNLQFRN